MESIYQTFAVTLLRNLLKVAGGALVARGLIDEGTAQEVAAGAALLIVTTVWDLWRIHRRALYQRWLVALGLDSPPDSDPSEIDRAAREAVRKGLQP